jgi:hypothetical protein
MYHTYMTVDVQCSRPENMFLGGSGSADPEIQITDTDPGGH